MVEEKSLMLEGENLAKVAVESEMGAKQLQTIYRLAKTRPLAYVEAHVKRQMSRIKGFMAFAKTLELLKKYEASPTLFMKVLMYAVMLYDYCEKEPVMKHRTVAEPVIRQVVEARGMTLSNVDMKLYGRSLGINVRVHRFSGNPKVLANEIEDALKRKGVFPGLSLRVWIESK